MFEVKCGDQGGDQYGDVVGGPLQSQNRRPTLVLVLVLTLTLTLTLTLNLALMGTVAKQKQETAGFMKSNPDPWGD